MELRWGRTCINGEGDYRTYTDGGSGSEGGEFVVDTTIEIW